MDSVSSFFHMGGYAQWVWPVYGLAALAIGGIFVLTLRTLRAREREFEILKSQRRGES